MSIKPTYQELYATFTSRARRVNELEGLANQDKELIQENQELIKENRGIIKQNQLLLKENRQLKDKLFTYENPKNSRNSSMPHSKDENHPKPNQSLRKSSDRKVGGQKGRKGKTLEMTAHPDEIIELYQFSF